MRLISLEVEGISSFKQKISVDFKALASKPLFGIFGETGSGKTTILDSIMIALYGEINRTKKIGEFINLESNFGSIRLIFEISNNESANQKCAYEIFRLFKINRQSEKTTSEAELFKIEKGERLLVAKGDLQVTEQIKNLLGFGSDEFKKCIIWQQGDFSSFLNESKQRQRETFAKLLSLEHYGSAVHSRLNATISNLQSRRSFLSGILSNQIDKSFDEEQAKYELQEQAAELEVCTARYSKLKAEKLSKEKQLLIEGEIAACQRELTVFEKQLENINLKRRALEIEKVSFKLLPLLSFRDAKNAEISTSEYKLKQIEKSLTDLAQKIKTIESSNSLKKTTLLLNLTSAELNKKVLSEANFSNIRLDKLYSRRGKLTDELANIKLETSRLEDEQQAEITQLENLANKLKDISDDYAETAIATSVLSDAKNLDKIKSEIALTESLINTNNMRLAEATSRRKILIDELSVLSLEHQALKDDWQNAEHSIGQFFAAQPDGAHAYPSPLVGQYISAANTTLSRPETLFAKNAGSLCALKTAIANLKTLRAKTSEYARQTAEFEKALAAAMSTEQQLKEQVEQTKNALSNYKNKYDQILFEREKYFGENLIVFLQQDLSAGQDCPVCANKIVYNAGLGKEVSLNAYDFELESIRHREIEEKAYLSETSIKLGEARQDILFIKAEISRLNKEFAEGKTQIDIIINEFPQFKTTGDFQLDNIERLAENAHQKFDELLNSVFDAKNLLIVKEQQLTKLSATIDELNLQIAEINKQQSKHNARIAELNIEAKTFENKFDNENLSEEIKKIESRKHKEEELQISRTDLISNILALMRKKEKLTVSFQTSLIKQQSIERDLELTQNEILTLEEKVKKIKIKNTIESDLREAERKITDIKTTLSQLEGEKDKLIEEEINLKMQKSSVVTNITFNQRELSQIESELNVGLRLARIAESDIVSDASLINIETLEREVGTFDYQHKIAQQKLNNLNEVYKNIRLSSKTIDAINAEIDAEDAAYQTKKSKMNYLTIKLDEHKKAAEKTKYFEAELKQINEKLTTFNTLQTTLQGGRLLEALTEEYLNLMINKANIIFAKLTYGRYQFAPGEELAIKDYLCGGRTRSVSTLSGGETFLASLSLAIATTEVLATYKNKSVKFLFIDEGFGTLDDASLDTVMDAMREFNYNNFVVGIITHEDVIKNRIANRIQVTKTAEGSQISVIY